MVPNRTLIFDFDGTIADSFVLLVDVFEEISKRKDKFTKADIEQLRGLQAREIIHHLKIKRWQVPRLLVRGRRAMAVQIDNVAPINGLPAVLEQLHSQGYRMLILSTNSNANIHKFLIRHGLADCFSAVYGGAGIFNKAAALKKLVKKERLKVSDCIYIGDEVRDIQAAKKAGLKYISAGWGFNSINALKAQKPMKLAGKPVQLPGIIKSL